MIPNSLRPFRTLVILAGLCLLTVMVYMPGLPGDFMFDDMPNLVQNHRLQVDSLDMNSLLSASYSSTAGLFKRPVSMATFALNRYFYGLAPWSYKIVNLVVHLLTGLAIFLLCRLLVNNARTRYKPGLSDRTIFWLPVVVSGLWLIHPLNLTPVLYIVQRMTSLAALFTVCGLCLYTLGRQRMLAGQHGMGHILGGLVIFGGLATLSKETGVLLPLYMLVIEFCLFRFRGKEETPSKTIIVFFAIVILVPICLFLVVLLVNPEIILNYHSRHFTLIERVLTETRGLFFYLKLIISPSISELGLYHDDITLSRSLLDPLSTLFSSLGLVALFSLALALRNKRPLASLGILWFFAGHALESTIFQLDIAYEHRNYLADMGIILALCSLATTQKVTRLAHFTRAVMPAFFLVVFAYTTWLRAGQWSDNVNHAVYEARHHPESFRAVFSAARIYARLAILPQPDMEERAFTYLDRASQLDENDIMADTIKIKLSAILGKPIEEEWLENIQLKVSRDPVRPARIGSLKELMDCIGTPCDIPIETMDDIFVAALRADSLKHLPNFHAELLNMYAYFTINKTNNPEYGLELFSQAVDLNPEEPQRWINLTNLQIAMGLYDDAELTLEKFKKAGILGGMQKKILELESEIDNLRNTVVDKSDKPLKVANP